MRDRRFRQNAVPEIEDERALTEVFQNFVDGAIERRVAGEQDQRIEVTLHGGLALYVLPDEARLRGPVDADRTDRYSIQISSKRSAGAARKSDNFCIRHFGTHL